MDIGPGNADLGTLHRSNVAEQVRVAPQLLPNNGSMSLGDNLNSDAQCLETSGKWSEDEHL